MRQRSLWLASSSQIITTRYSRPGKQVCRTLIAFQTLDAFLKEAGLPPDAGVTAPGDWTVEKILEEKRQYDASIIYEKISGEENNQGWNLPGENIELGRPDLHVYENL